MADDAAGAEEQVTFNVKSSNEAKYTLTLPRSTTVGDLKAKLSTSEYADTPADRQRLIYSGRVLKDHDTLDRFKIKDGHTIHMVKSAASNVRQNPSSQGSSTTVPGAGQRSNVPTNIATGTGHDPLAGLTGARYAGLMGLPGANAFGPDGGMGAPPDSDQILRRLEDPNTLQMMTEALNNPIVLQQMRNSPMFRDNPAMQQMLDNPAFRRIMTDPEIIRAQLRMTRELRGGGAGGEGANSFPAPGVTNTTPQQNNPSDTAAGGNNAGAQGANVEANPFSLFSAPPFGPPAGANAQANPFAALFGAPPPAPGAGDNQNQNENRNQNPQNPPPNPFAGLFGGMGGDPTNPAAGPPSNNGFANMLQNVMANPEAMRAAMQMVGGGFPGANSGADGNDAAAAGAGANPFAGLFGAGGAGGAFDNPVNPPDNRPPEERYADQLRQLNEMGFYEFERNVQALRRSGGSVQGAIEYLLSGP